MASQASLSAPAATAGGARAARLAQDEGEEPGGLRLLEDLKLFARAEEAAAGRAVLPQLCDALRVPAQIVSALPCGEAVKKRRMSLVAASPKANR